METIFKDFLEAISPALQTLLVTLVTVVVGQISLYINTKWSTAKVNLSNERRYLLELIARNAVETVEQVYNSSDNMVKKNQAIAIVENSLKEFGLNIDIDVIADVIEAEVFSHKNTPQG